MPKAPQRSPGPAHSPALAQPCSAAQHHVGLSTDPLGGSGPYRDAAISSHPCDRRANPEQMISSGSAPCSRPPSSCSGGLFSFLEDFDFFTCSGKADTFAGLCRLFSKVEMQEGPLVSSGSGLPLVHSAERGAPGWCPGCAQATVLHRLPAVLCCWGAQRCHTEQWMRRCAGGCGAPLGVPKGTHVFLLCFVLSVGQPRSAVFGAPIGAFAEVLCCTLHFKPAQTS